MNIIQLNEKTIEFSSTKLFSMYLAEAGALNDLRASTKRVAGDSDRENSDSKGTLDGVKYIAYEDNQQLLISATTKSKKGNDYQTQIMFEGVEYHQEDEQGLATFMGAEGSDHTISKLNDSATHVKVACGCMDFYYRFAQYNFDNGTLLGDKPPPYAKKPGSNRPSVNPTREPGMCKHLFGLMDHLKQQGFF